MSSLTSLKKNELITLAKKHNIIVRSTMTKLMIIQEIEKKGENINFPPKSLLNKKTVSTNKNNKNTSIFNSQKNSKPKIQPPTKYITPVSSNHITILPQSESKILIIWHADLDSDAQNKAWQITNELGLDILLPSYARSIFVNIEILKNHPFYLYLINHQNVKKLYGHAQYSIESNYQDFTKVQKKHIDRLMIKAFKNSSSDNNFNSSSDNNFRN